jgi:hypothetical protein
LELYNELKIPEIPMPIFIEKDMMERLERAILIVRQNGMYRELDFDYE